MAGNELAERRDKEKPSDTFHSLCTFFLFIVVGFGPAPSPCVVEETWPMLLRVHDLACLGRRSGTKNKKSVCRQFSKEGHGQTLAAHTFCILAI